MIPRPTTQVIMLARRGEANEAPPIDPVLLALTLGATFVARSFSGDKAQLVPILKAGLSHGGFALIDIISPCVTFNDHEGSTKSYVHTRTHDGSVLRFRKPRAGCTPTDRLAAYSHVKECNDRGEVATGLLFLDARGNELHLLNKTVQTPLVEVPYAELCPGSKALEELMAEYR